MTLDSNQNLIDSNVEVMKQSIPVVHLRSAKTLINKIIYERKASVVKMFTTMKNNERQM